MRPDRAILSRSIALALAVAPAAGCSAESEPGSWEAPASARDTLADELGAIICHGASGCCASLGHGAPGEDCHTSMRNAVMIGVIEAEHAQRTLVPERIDACLSAFEAAIDEATDCAALPAPGELSLRCPDLFTPERAGTERSGALPPCPHDEETCGYPAAGPAPCPGGDCWTLVFENVCR